MFEHLIASNNLEEVMEDYHLVLKEDMIFIKEQIGGPIDETASDNAVSDCSAPVVIAINVFNFTERVDNFASAMFGYLFVAPWSSESPGTRGAGEV